MTERDAVRYGDATIEYQVVRSRRRKRTIEITLDPNEGVRVAAPLHVSRTDVREVVLQRAGWITKKTANAIPQAPRIEFVDGATLPYLGGELRLVVVAATVRHVCVRRIAHILCVEVPLGLPAGDQVQAVDDAIISWYVREAGEHIEARVRHWSEVVGRFPTRVLIRNQRQRWGSCAPDGTLRFNWRIVLAEPAIMDYVVVHELSHLAVRNHSQRFWLEVERTLPDYKERRARLKAVGPLLTL
jgi:predicted metal-dependent hydrolase